MENGTSVSSVNGDSDQHRSRIVQNGDINHKRSENLTDNFLGSQSHSDNQSDISGAFVNDLIDLSDIGQSDLSRSGAKMYQR